MRSDEDLLAAVVTGDREAFAELFRRRNGNVFRFALHMLGDRSLADDVTQEVFLAVIQDARRFDRSRSSAVAWLCGIARHHALRRIAQDQRAVPLDDEAGDPVASGDVVLELTRSEAVEAVRAAVLALPVPYREAVALCDLQEMSYADAAAALGCAVGTVRSRLHRGRALLEEKLAGHPGIRCIA